MDQITSRYIFRLDDITPAMNWENFYRIEKIFDTYGIKPIIGVVPDNQDMKLNGFGPIDDFWGRIRDLHAKGWTIAQHGYQHQYINTDPGIVGINKYSEFAGLSYDEQYEKIITGKEIMEESLGFAPKWWMAPAHSFDETTCKILKELDFEYITDGIALFPFEKYGLKWLPQQIWKTTKMPFGVWTICLHINTYNTAFIDSIESFCASQHSSILSYPEKISYQSSVGKEIANFFYKQYFHLARILYILLYK